MDKKELSKQLKNDILGTIYENPGIRPIALMQLLREYLQHGFDILGTIDNMISKKMILEILYVLPETRKQYSILFPIGTKIIRPRVVKKEKDANID